MNQKSPNITKQIRNLDKQISALQKERAKLRFSQSTEIESDYEFIDHSGKKVSLSGLFDERNRVLVIHNMGKSCPYCTMWADGFNGLLAHLSDYAVVVLETPDEPKEQRAFRKSRGWKFHMVSSAKNSFKRDMGVMTKDGYYIPGVSAFTRDKKGKIVRTAFAELGPGDDFNAAWHLFTLFPNAGKGWYPKFSYE